MKYGISIILGLTLIFIAVYIVKAYKETHKFAPTVRKILLMGWSIVLVYMTSLLVEDKRICVALYSMYFILADWLLYNLFRFSIEYIGSSFEQHVKKWAMWALLIADSLSIASNNLFGHLFYVEEGMLPTGEMCLTLHTKPAFFSHYAIIVMLVAFCLVSLYYRSVTAPLFYRRKYFAIALILSLIIVVNIVGFFTIIDYSVLGYVAEGICIYYCAFVYTPQKLLPKTLFMVAQDMVVGLYVMDVEGKKLYCNKCATDFLDSEEPLRNKEGMTLEEWCYKLYMENDSDVTVEENFYRDNKELILKIQLQKMVDVNKQLQGGYFVIQDRTEEINNLKEEQYRATHDYLTGLYNHARFCDDARLFIKRHSDEPLYMICTDIKDFKMINDYLGTNTGDTVLINYGKLLKEKIKDNGIYGRLGNDIFGVLIKKADFDETIFDCEKQEDFFGEAQHTGSFPIISYVGVYEITEPDIPINVMCDRARLAIATIKGDYHRRVAFYDEKLRHNILKEQELIGDLSTAIEEEQLKMYLQPQMSADGKLLGAEALIRWFHPTKGQIMPGEFIPVFEKNGLISNVDRYIWEVACKKLKKWKEMGKDDVYISVNISPRDFYFMNIYQTFIELIDKYDIDPQNLKLEITETAVVMDLKRQIELITRLRQTGFVVEMDDFGSGYSSLNMLKDIHVDVLKIDMAFLKKARDEERSKKILQMIISLSKHLEMPVITEGVENADQVKFLSEMGCEIFQGYYFAKPMSVEEFEQRYIATNKYN